MNELGAGGSKSGISESCFQVVVEAEATARSEDSWAEVRDTKPVEVEAFDCSACEKGSECDADCDLILNVDPDDDAVSSQ